MLMTAWTCGLTAGDGPGNRMMAVTTGRDVRVDFFRGLCLLVIFTRHVNPSALRDYMPSALGFSDAAEAFVFLSGFVCGRAYGKAMRGGFLACQMKALRRCWQIYAAHILTLFLNLALVTALFGGQSVTASGFLQDPAGCLQRAFLLSYFPDRITVLALYILLVALVPSGLWLARRLTPYGMATASFLVYSAVQGLPGELELPGEWAAAVGYNPFAWQFLFFFAVALGGTRLDEGFRPPAGKAMIVGAAVLLAVLFLAKRRYAAGESPWNLQEDSLPWGKADLEPLRLVSFALFAYLCWAMAPEVARSYRGRAASAFVHCGRYSLPVFCLGLCLTSLANETLQRYGHSLWRDLAANLGGWALMLLFGALLHAADRARAAVPAAFHSSPTPAEPEADSLAGPNGHDSVAKEHERERATAGSVTQ